MARTFFDINLGQVSFEGTPIGAVTPGTGAFTQLSIAPGGLFLESFTDAIVASATQTQAGATQLVSEVNRVATVAARNNGIRLPPSQPGLTIMVINHGVNPMQVYGSGSDTVDDVVATAGVSQMQGSVSFYVCATAGNWYSEGIGTGYSGSFQTFSSVDGLTATGSTQGTAFLLNSMQNRFTTVAASTGAILPLAVPGMSILVINAGANSLQVYGNGTDTINGTAGATGVALAAGKVADYVTCTAGAWHVLLSA